MLIELLYLFLLGVLYFLVAYVMVILYEKGVSTFKIRLFLIFALIAYTGLVHEMNDVWSPFEIGAIFVIFLAHIFTINRNTLNSNRSMKNDENNIEEVPENTHSLNDWIMNFLLLSWLFHNDDDDDDGWHL